LGYSTKDGGPRLFCYNHLMTTFRATLNHIGIAAADLPQLKRLFLILGMGVASTEAVPDQGVVTHFLPFVTESASSNLELLEVTDPEGTVAKFIAKRGAGVHHLSFRVAAGELDALCAQLKDEGYRLTYDAPRNGAHHMRVNFIHPASAGGILIEVMEPRS
jgi:methylmalonyl-CoA/ethylmalonyl-CoA epimerase